MIARTHSHAPPGSTMGFATLIEGEGDLARALGTAARGLEGTRAANTARIFAHQVGQIGAIVSLLLQRRSEFPVPQRFERPAAQHPRATRHPAQAGPTEPPTLDGFRNRHLAFATRLERLAASTASSANHEELLREAKQLHEEMAWMLSALINEDLTTARAPQAFPATRRAGSRPELERWENEGGGIAPAPRSAAARHGTAGNPPPH